MIFGGVLNCLDHDADRPAAVIANLRGSTWIRVN
jgi:hypothetical protein